MSNEKFKVKFGLAVGDTQATIDGTTGDIVTAGNTAVNGSSITTTQTTFNVINTNATTVNAFGAATTLNIGNSGGTTTVNGDLAVNGGDITTSQTTGNLFNTTATTVNIAGAATTVNIGSASSNTVITNDLTVTGGDINNVANINGQTGTNFPINITPDGTGDVGLVADTVIIGDSNVNAVLTTNGTGNLTISTANSGSNSNIVLTQGTNGAITVTPNGTGNLALVASNGGNLTNSRNYVFGAIRNSTTQSIGDIWALNSTGPVQPFRGISIDNSSDTSKLPGYLARSYSNTAGFRSRVIFERARGTAASPTAVQAGDFLGEVDATGYTSTGWLNDNVITGGGVPALFGFTAVENWVSNTNIGTAFGLQLAPTATTITSGTNLIQTITSTPQLIYLRGDRIAIAQGKTAGFNATGCSTSGTTLTIGTLTSGTIAVGQVLTFATTGTAAGIYIIANISGSGSGSTWTLSESPGTLSAQVIVGNAGYIGGTTTATTVDALQNLKLLKNNILASDGNTNITTTSNTLTTFAGDIRVNGNDIQASDGNTNISMTSNTLTAFAGDIKLGGNDIQSSNGTTQISTSASGTTLALAGDTLNFNNAAGTNLMNLSQESLGGGLTNTSLTLLKTNSSGTTPEVSTVNLTSYRTTGASQSGDKLGQFKFNGSSATGVVAGPVGSFNVYAAETFTGSAQGGRAIVQINKTGTTSSYSAFDFQSSAGILSADTITLKDSAGTNLTGNNINYNRVYGAFQYNTTVTPAAANTAYVFPIGTTDFANIVSVGSTSRIIIGAAGIYNLQFSVQVENTANQEHVAYIWLRKNGADVTGSMGRITLLKSASTIAGWNYYIDSANTTDYYEIAYAVDNTAVIFPTYAATAFGPGTASLITTISPVGA